MIELLAFLGLVIGMILIVISFLLGEKIASISALIIGVLIFLATFIFTPLMVKVGLLFILGITSFYLEDILSKYIFNQLKK